MISLYCCSSLLVIDETSLELGQTNAPLYICSVFRELSMTAALQYPATDNNTA